jgi:hypothetical protein
MKIEGLVRAFQRVRVQLQTGLAPDEVELFRQRVTVLVQQVEAICRQHGVTPDHLPAPSRMAYTFLKTLDLTHLPLRSADEPAAATAGVKLKNVVKLGDQLAERFWQQHAALLASAEQRTRIQQDIGQHVTTIESLCAQHGQTPAALEAPSRQVYGWLKFLESGENLTLHLEALQRARQALDAQSSRRPVHVHLLCLNSLWRKREYQNAVLLKVNEGFLLAESPVWQALLHSALSQRLPMNDALLRDYAESEAFSEVLLEMEAFAAPPVLSARGRAHDLDESFARVNAAYFGSQMAKPTLAWNRMLTARKFGHYQASRDTVMLSVTLDDRQVPALVVDFVLYHELLHKKHGVMTVNGRRSVHSPSFRAEERRFEDYDKAEQHLHELALKHRRQSGL